MNVPFPPELNIRVHYAQHILWLGPLESGFESMPVSGLTGTDLDFAVAVSVASDGTIDVDFLPTLRPEQVTLESKVMRKTVWNPSSNEVLARQLLASTPISTIDKSYLDALRELVQSKYGDYVDVVRLRRQE